MTQDLKCFFGLHRYKLLETKELKNNFNVVVGNVYVNRCEHCGKIHNNVAYTLTGYGR